MPLVGYLEFARAHRRFLGFGFLLACFSSVGQTYFVGVFGPSIMAEFSLGHGAWGGLYMAGTLLSAAALPFTGRLVDQVELGRFALGVIALLVLAALAAALVPAAWLLVPTIFLLRQSGQGLASHLMRIAMARYFTTGRGKALALGGLGFSLGEALWPLAGVAAIGALGWRSTWLAVAGLCLAVLLPAALWLLRGQAERHAAWLADAAAAEAKPGAARSWTRREVLRDGRFWLFLPAVTAPAMIVTALFFHHLTLAESKGWSAAWITGSYVFYAAAGILASIVAGPLVDRFGARRLLPGLLLPLIAGLAVLASFDAPLSAWPYLIAVGLTGGAAATLYPALWAELYGTRHLGAIKAMAAALMVFASALGPPLLGLLFDLGVPGETSCWLFAGYCAAATACLLAGLARERPMAKAA
ncbi:Predicted arabinose efflux permease, MFS family [Tistlia consotensis]|uniref:Predicted arabinose efflux permease, MFS family n=1 Tax=Tistlia consotensis USBA 355 TaxID=560819 RepID=A0A1Y6CCU1_9PROT|nr:MFS transporter [Tistlia consotensis]SMF47955.1 Predicted arabinose efflux permease, MFS family [Tistlia consotensis USBA 355]SNR82048.1 Predicted arabinose efflux permease, MFS family [Tistlia consotensis]